MSSFLPSRILETPEIVRGSSWLTLLLFVIGNAKILNSSTGDDMQTRVNMTEHEFTVALMVFLVAYSVFEAPSNLALKVLSPHRYVQRRFHAALQPSKPRFLIAEE